MPGHRSCKAFSCSAFTSGCTWPSRARSTLSIRWMTRSPRRRRCPSRSVRRLLPTRIPTRRYGRTEETDSGGIPQPTPTAIVTDPNDASPLGHATPLYFPDMTTYETRTQSRPRVMAAFSTSPLAPDQIALMDFSVWSAASTAILRHWSVRMGHACEDPATAGNIEPSKRHAERPSGVAAIATTRATPPARSSNTEPQPGSPVDDSLNVGERIAAAIRALGAAAREARARYQRIRHARAVCAALRGLDDHILRDLGIDRSEISSVAAEAAGHAEITRIRVLQGIPRFGVEPLFRGPL